MEEELDAQLLSKGVDCVRLNLWYGPKLQLKLSTLTVEPPHKLRDTMLVEDLMFRDNFTRGRSLCVPHQQSETFAGDGLNSTKNHVGIGIRDYYTRSDDDV